MRSVSRFGTGALRRIAVGTGIVALVGCVQGPPESESPPTSTFETHYRLAERGDAYSQNLVGFMLFFGEMAPPDRGLAHHWFRRAAEQDHVGALLNLSLLHYFGIGGPRDTGEAQRRFQQAQEANLAGEATRLPSSLSALVLQSCARPRAPTTVGEEAYSTFCAGCHGLNGIAAYGGSPSFALGERMEKSDDELFNTVVSGHGVMPDWSDKLPREFLREALRFARSLEMEFSGGVLHPLREPPERYFLFGPMVADSIAFQRDSILASGDSEAYTGELCAQP